MRPGAYLHALRSPRTGSTTVRVFLLGAILAGSSAQAQSWPQWRGPTRSGVTSALSGWDGSKWNLQKRWQVAVGAGLGGSPIIVHGNVYVMGRGQQGDIVWCLDARDGKPIWKQEYQAPCTGRFQRGESPEGPTCTPTFDKETGYLYTRGNDGDLYCWDTAHDHARQVWHINLYDTYKVPARLSSARVEPFRDYGYTGNVLLYRDWAILEVGSPQAGNILAFNKRTGQRVWNSQDRHLAGHSCGPVMLQVQGKPCIVSFTLEGLCVMRADAGHEGVSIAFFPWTMPYNENMPTPCVSGDTVVLTGTPHYASRKKTTFLKIGLSGILTQWQGQRQSFLCSPVAHEGCVYAVSGKLYCLDLATGALRWEGGQMEGETGSVLVTGDDKVIVWGNRHLLLVESARRSPDRYKELAALEEPIANSRGDCFSHAALGEGYLLIKDGSGQLACYAVGSRLSRPVSARTTTRR